MAPISDAELAAMSGKVKALIAKFDAPQRAQAVVVAQKVATGNAEWQRAVANAASPSAANDAALKLAWRSLKPDEMRSLRVGVEGVVPPPNGLGILGHETYGLLALMSGSDLRDLQDLLARNVALQGVADAITNEWLQRQLAKTPMKDLRELINGLMDGATLGASSGLPKSVEMLYAHLDSDVTAQELNDVEATVRAQSSAAPEPESPVPQPASDSGRARTEALSRAQYKLDTLIALVGDWGTTRVEYDLERLVNQANLGPLTYASLDDLRARLGELTTDQLEDLAEEADERAIDERAERDELMDEYDAVVQRKPVNALSSSLRSLIARQSSRIDTRGVVSPDALRDWVIKQSPATIQAVLNDFLNSSDAVASDAPPVLQSALEASSSAATPRRSSRLAGRAQEPDATTQSPSAPTGPGRVRGLLNALGNALGGGAPTTSGAENPITESASKRDTRGDQARQAAAEAEARRRADVAAEQQRRVDAAMASVTTGMGQMTLHYRVGDNGQLYLVKVDPAPQPRR